MKPAQFRYECPQSLDEALDLLAGSFGDVKVLAGGQSLVPMMNFRVARPEVLVDINRLQGLSDISIEGGAIRIGALARHADVMASPTMQEHCPIVVDAYEWVAHHPIRTRGTLCGNLVHADPASEMPALMIALDATMIVRKAAGSREVPASEFFLGVYETALEPDEMLVAVVIPKPPSGMRYGLSETSMRKGDFAICFAAAILETSGGQINSAKLAVSGLFDCAQRLTEVEAEMAGKSLDEIQPEHLGALASGLPGIFADQRLSEEYKRDVLRANLTTAITRAIAMENAHG